MYARRHIHPWEILFVIVALLVTAGDAGASGFQLNEQSARLLGTGLAGTAALAADATTNYFNPAGMTLLENGGLAGTVAWIHADNRLDGTSATTIGQPDVTGPGGSLKTTDVLDAFVPSFFAVQKVRPDLALGLGVSSPFGLKTNYPPDSMLRYVSTLSSLQVININANVAWQATDKLSIGVGFNAANARAHLNQNVSLNPALPDGNVLLYGTDWSYGWNVGLMYQIAEGTRIGLAYRSQMAYTLTGQSDYIDQNGVNHRGDVSAGLTTPGFLTASGMWSITPKWQILGDFQWTQWSRFTRVDVDVASLGLPTSSVTLDLGFRDAFRGALGVRYLASDDWTFSGGVSFDQSPVTTATRGPRLPDANRVLLGLGVGRRLWDNIYLDIAYMHVFVNDAPINFTSANVDQSTYVGNANSRVDLLAVQVTYNWDSFPPKPF